MSTNFAPLMKISAADLFDGRLENFGIREHLTENTTTDWRMLTDGDENYLCVAVNDRGLVAYFTRYAGCNNPGKILRAIDQVFDANIVSEYEPQYWGFETSEQFIAARSVDLGLKAEDYDKLDTDISHRTEGGDGPDPEIPF
jgi:hypothetical protein